MEQIQNSRKFAVIQATQSPSQPPPPPQTDNPGKIVKDDRASEQK